MKSLCLLFLLLSTPALAQNPYLNLGFEDGLDGAAPKGWFAGGEGYTGTVSTDDPYEGIRCLLLEKTGAGRSGFGVATGAFPIEAARGHRVRYTGWIRTEGVADGWAGLWWRVDGPDGMLAFDNMATRGVTGTTGWAQHAIELEVAPEAVNINFGCLLPGTGKAWFDDLRVELDGVPYEQVRPEPFAATDEQVAWIKGAAQTFATDDPGHGNVDLAFLKDLVGGARVVALGEGTHGTAEFFRMKHRIVRCLVEEMGFTHFAIEASQPETELLNAYVHGGEGDPAALIAGMHFWTWRTQEVLALVEWMRAHNAAGGQVSFQGFDMQHPARSMAAVRDFVAAHAPDLVVDMLTAYAELRGTIKGAENSGNLWTVIGELDAEPVLAIRRGLEARRAELVAATSEAEVARVLHSARLVEQYLQMYGRDQAAGRDASMAENVEWLLDRAGPQARMILWAHNGHVGRRGGRGGDIMGTHLDRALGRDMVVLGFLFHEGTYTAMKRGEGLGAWGTSPSRPGTVEWAFHRTGEPRLVLDLRRAEPGSAASGWVLEPAEMRSIGAMAVDDAFYDGVIGETFDAVVYFEASTPSVLLEVEAPSPWAAWD